MASATGLAVFDKTLQTTHFWLEDVMEAIGPDRETAWHALGAVLRTLRDRLPLGLVAHLGAELPILVRGAYYDRWEPSKQPQTWRTADEFLGHVAQQLDRGRPVDAAEATRAVFNAIDHYVEPNQADHVREALPEAIRSLWSIASVATH